jgi:hypothetical protein
LQNVRTIARRQLMALAGAGLLTLGTRAPARAQAQEQQEKLSKPEAEYQDKPKNDQQCSECTKFQPPKGCSVVSGDISAKGWCKLYEAPPE